MVSMKEIAKKCNVSVASVSKALNGYSDISEETRKLILRTASEMGYLPNSSARTLKTKRSYNIGVMFVDEAASGLTHDYFNHVLESFKRTAEEKGYDIYERKNFRTETKLLRTLPLQRGRWSCDRVCGFLCR